MIVAIKRYFRLREVACDMGVRTRWYWLNERVASALYDERVRREIAARVAARSFPKPRKILDFRTYRSGGSN